MSKKKDQRASRFWGIFNDPWRKLASLALALLLWYWLDSRATLETTYSTVVDFNDSSNLTNNVIRVELPTDDYRFKGLVDGDNGAPLVGGKAQLTLSGATSVVKAVENQLIYTVRAASKDVVFQGGEYFLTVRLGDLHHQKAEFDGIKNGLSPRTIRVILAKNERINVALGNGKKVAIEWDDPKQRRRKKKMSFSPTAVEIFGPLEQLRGIEKKEVFLVKIRAAEIQDNQVTKVLELRKEIAAKGFQIGRGQSVSVVIDFHPPWEEYDLASVPVVVDMHAMPPADQNKYTWLPERLNLTLKVAGALHSELASLGGQKKVDRVWTADHARLMIFLGQEDLERLTDEGAALKIRPSILLFTIGAGRKREFFKPGVDYDEQQLFDQIEIKLKKDGN